MPSENYIRRGHKTVEGWLNPFSARFIAALSKVHGKLGVTGSVGEIGVHHGKLFILLHADSDGTRSFAIDVFGNQHLNLDHSGKGSYAHFVRNVTRWCGSTLGVEIIQRSSLDVRPSDITGAVGTVRLFSIDGGHTEECTINDIRIAEGSIGDFGVVILDDVFNPQWPGVMTGLAKYLMDETAMLRPFAISPGKVYLCKPNDADVLMREMRERFTGDFEFDKDSLLFGSTVDIYGIYEQNNPTRYKAKRLLSRVGLLSIASDIRTKTLNSGDTIHN